MVVAFLDMGAFLQYGYVLLELSPQILSKLFFKSLLSQRVHCVKRCKGGLLGVDVLILYATINSRLSPTSWQGSS